ncbi:MAG: ATP-binding protein [Tannerellaceae bacterium]|jgi:anti-sigma regulatory factor (Ser/Thr protein kinase)|nr:ATP-binding protein [Tannerellaceae bacterium]
MAEPLHIKNEINQLAKVNEYLRQTVRALGLSSSARTSLKLAVEEAVVNAILYAYPGETDKDIFICLEHNEDKVTVVITDYGLAFDLTAREEPDVSLPLEERPIGGLGTFLVKQLMTEVSYRRIGNKNVLTMVKLIHP